MYVCGCGCMCVGVGVGVGVGGGGIDIQSPSPLVRVSLGENAQFCHLVNRFTSGQCRGTLQNWSNNLLPLESDELGADLLVQHGPLSMRSLAPTANGTPSGLVMDERISALEELGLQSAFSSRGMDIVARRKGDWLWVKCTCWEDVGSINLLLSLFCLLGIF